LPVARPARVWRALEPQRAAFAQHGGAKPCGKTWRCNPAPPRLQDRGDAEAELLLVWRPLETAPPAAGDGGDAAAGDEGGASPEVARDARLRACRAAALAAAAALRGRRGRGRRRSGGAALCGPGLQFLSSLCIYSQNWPSASLCCLRSRSHSPNITLVSRRDRSTRPWPGAVQIGRQRCQASRMPCSVLRFCASSLWSFHARMLDVERAHAGAAHRAGGRRGGRGGRGGGRGAADGGAEGRRGRGRGRGRPARRGRRRARARRGRRRARAGGPARPWSAVARPRRRCVSRGADMCSLLAAPALRMGMQPSWLCM